MQPAIDIVYKGVSIRSFNPIEDFWTKPIDWLEKEGMLVPTSMRVAYPNPVRESSILGRYSTRKNEIVIFRGNEELDLTMLHELVHAWQNKEGHLEDNSPRPTCKLEYRLLPHEVEAFWWMNEFHLDQTGKEHKSWSYYAEEGFSLF